MASNRARGLRDGRRWGPVAVSWGGIHSDNKWRPFYSCFARFYPVNGVIWPQNGPKRWPRHVHHRGLVAVSWDEIHLGNVRAAFWPRFACLSPVNSVIWPQNGPKIGLKMAEIEFCSKNDPRVFGVLKDTFSGRFEPVLERLEALKFGPNRP